MSFDAKAWHRLMYEVVEEYVELGLERVGNEIQRLGKSRAPVRKHTPFRRRRESRPLILGFTDRATRERVSTTVVLERASKAGGSKKGVLPSTALGIFRAAKVIPSPVRKIGSRRLTSEVQSEIRRGQGVYFNAATGRFQYGGFLRASILRDEFVEKEGPVMRIKVVAHAPYARYVEFGTRNMKAQPFLYPALMQAFGRIGQYMGMRER